MLKLICSCSRQIFFYVCVCVGDALVSFILKCCPLLRVNFHYWEANLPSNRANLSRVNFTRCGVRNFYFVRLLRRLPLSKLFLRVAHTPSGFYTSSKY